MSHFQLCCTLLCFPVLLTVMSVHQCCQIPMDMEWTKRNLDLHIITDPNALNIERSKNHTVHICTQGHKGNPQGYQASWSFARRSAHGFLFLSVLEATAHQQFLQIIIPHKVESLAQAQMGFEMGNLMKQLKLP